MVVGDPLEVKLSLDDSDMARAEKATNKALGSIESAMKSTANVVKSVFAASIGAVVTSGMRDWLKGSERTMASLGASIQNSFATSAKTAQTFAATVGQALANVGPQVGAFAARMATSRALLVGGLVGAVAVAGVVAFNTEVKAAIKSMDDMAMSARNIGQSTESFSQLAFAAQTTGVSLDSFKASMSSLATSLEKDDAFAPTIRALQALGLESNSATQPTLTMNEVLSKVADKFSRMEDGVNKTALATALFGEKGADLIPVLNRGSSAIEELRSKSDALGGTLGAKAAQDAREYTESMAKFGTIISLISKEIGSAFLPVYKSAADALSRFAERMNLATNIGGAFRTLLGGIYIAARPIVGIFESMTTSIGAAVAAIVKIMSGDFTGAKEALAKGGTDLANIWKGVGNDIVDTTKYISPAFGSAVASATGLGTAMNGVATAGEKMKAPALRSVAEIQAAMEKAKAVQREAFTELSANMSIPLTQKLAEMKVMVDNGSISWQQYFTAVRAAKDAQYQLTAEIARMNAQDIMADAKLPITQKIDELNAMVREGTLTWREYHGMMRNVSDQGRQQMDDLASTTSQALTTIFKENKAAAIASAIINTYQGITKAIANYPPPMSYAMAGLQAAMGFAQVQQIKNTSKSSSGGGGSAPSSSGASTAAASGGGGGSGGGQQTLYVQGISKSERFDRETVRHLAQSLIDHQRDGGRVILAP